MCTSPAFFSVICAKALGKKAALIERHYMGGDCLNVGCFPSKAIIRCARAIHEVRSWMMFLRLDFRVCFASDLQDPSCVATASMAASFFDSLASCFGLHIF
jgi:hypothetical protein